MEGHAGRPVSHPQAGLTFEMDREGVQAEPVGYGMVVVVRR